MFIDRLKKLREAKGLTQTQMGNALGISSQRYNYYENGKREPDNEMLKQIASFLDVSTDYLLGASDNPSHLNKASDFIVKMSPSEPFQQLDELPEDVQKQIIDFYNYHVERHLREKRSEK